MRTAASARTAVLVAHPSADLYGSDRMTLETVSGLLDQGWDVVVTVPADGAFTAEARRRGARVVVRPTPVLRKAALTPRGLLALVAGTVTAVPAGVRLLREVRPAAVYVATVTLPLWLVLARCLRIPTICHVHEAERGLPRSVRRVLAAQLRLARRIVANSEVTRRLVAEDWPGLAGRIRVVLNGIARPAVVVPARARLDAPLRLVVVGRVSARKGADLAVDAVLRLRDLGVPARLDLVGDVVAGAPEYRDALRRRVERVGLRDAVRFAGFAPDVWPHLQACDVVLVPSRGDESFGNAAVEAVLAARPVLVADVAGLREATAPYASARVVSAADAAAWADAVLATRDAWDGLREQALRDAESAAQTLAPARYRALIAAEVAELVGAGGTGRVSVPVLEGSAE